MANNIRRAHELSDELGRIFVALQSDGADAARLYQERRAAEVELESVLALLAADGMWIGSWACNRRES